MAKQKKTKFAAEKASSSAAPSQLKTAQPSTAPVSGKGIENAGQPATTAGLPITAGQPATCSAMAATKPGTQVVPSLFREFISEMETPPPPTAKHVLPSHAPISSGQQTEVTEQSKQAAPNTTGLPKTSFAGLFNNNRKLSSDNKLTKFTVEDGPLTLQPNDLVDVRAKLGHCLVGYIAGKFPGLKAIRSLAQSWGPLSTSMTVDG
ncbi:hypothetical protein Salat_1903700 [Sesamum alatum]|uniref:Uncharacterized protein n=1 Tax=Sesamum alatum TaxID=300844 RepID=A0AAE1Y4L9_9LAMI|nr:hypothetical protein Salat_1903700 [Sesamum alatum]